jgi:hypothetical protein
MLPKWKVLLGIVVVFALGGFVLANVDLQYRYIPPRKSDFNLLFKYGVEMKNELNTFDNTYTKDMILSPSITIGLYLSAEEMNQIQQELIAIDFFNCPETFPPSTERFVVPVDSYFILVQNGSAIKEMTWNTNSELGSLKENITQLARCITGIVEQRPEYARMPPPNGGYC